MNILRFEISTSLRISALVLAAAFSGQLQASDGALEINHACALAGCFSGDTPGYPVTITATGAYKLTSNITAPSTVGISVTASGVTLDLGGFTISGPISCSGTPLACTPSAPYGPGGIQVSSVYEGVRIRNGTVKGFGSGISTGRSNVVEDVTVAENQNRGIFLGDGASARNITAIYNGRAGIETNIRAEIVDSVANYNGQFGIALNGTTTNGGSTVRNSSAYQNGTWGIYDGGRSIIDGCKINENGGPGIENADGGSLIINSVVTANGGAAVHLRAGLHFWEPGGTATSFAGNTFTANNGGSANPQITGPGVKRFLSPSLCGSSVCN